MPDTMIERIAQTIYFADHPGAPEGVAPTEREIMMARDILEVMREPTEGMADAMECGPLPQADGHPNDEYPTSMQIWMAGIDAALSEGRR